MAKCVLLFLFLIISCSRNGENPEDLQIKFTQAGEFSFFERNGEILSPDTISSDLWIFEINKVAVWGIDGDIPDNLMKIQANSIAVLGKNAVLPKVFALQFSFIILKPDFNEEEILKITTNFDGILYFIGENQKITMISDGVFWYRLEI